MLSVPGAELRPGDRWKGHLQTQVKGNLREERVLDGGKISIRLFWTISPIPSILHTLSVIRKRSRREKTLKKKKKNNLKYCDGSIRNLISESQILKYWIPARKHKKKSCFYWNIFPCESGLLGAFLNTLVGVWLPRHSARLTFGGVPDPPWSLQTLSCFGKNRSQCVSAQLWVFRVWILGVFGHSPSKAFGSKQTLALDVALQQCWLCLLLHFWVSKQSWAILATQTHYYPWIPDQSEITFLGWKSNTPQAQVWKL